MATRTRVVLARGLTSPVVGRVLQRVSRNRVFHRGLTFDTTGWHPSQVAALAFGLYERAELSFVRRYLGGAERILELGGNVGVIGSFALQGMAQEGEYVSIEANRMLIPLLERALGDHADGRTIQVKHLAVSSSPELRFVVEHRNLGSHLGAVGDPVGERVTTASLGSIVDDLSWNNFCLISDIEGAEAEFLLGTDDAFKGCELAIIELHSTSFEGETFSPEALLGIVLSRHQFTLIDRHGPVVVCRR